MDAAVYSAVKGLEKKIVKNRVSYKTTFTTSSTSLVTALQDLGSGRIICIFTSGGGSYIPIVKVTVDGVLISYGKAVANGGSLPTGQWFAVTDGVGTVYNTTGMAANCQMAFDNSLLVELASTSGSVSVTVIYEIDE